MMKTIVESAHDYCKSTLVGSTYIKSHAYVQGAMDVLKELSITVSVSDDESLKDNLKILIKDLKGDLEFDNGTIDNNINF